MVSAGCVLWAELLVLSFCSRLPCSLLAAWDVLQACSFKYMVGETDRCCLSTLVNTVKSGIAVQGH